MLLMGVGAALKDPLFAGLPRTGRLRAVSGLRNGAN